MNPSEARQKLLQQHVRLRELVSEAGGLAARLLVVARELGDVVAGSVLLEFRQAIHGLQEAVAEHNACEEAVLEPVLRGADAWGPLRVERMFEEHKAEHAAFLNALSGDELDVAARFAELAEDLDAHMAAEERTFLSPAVLRDDIVNLDSCS